MGLSKAKIAAYKDPTETGLHVTKVLDTHTSFISVVIETLGELEELRRKLGEIYENPPWEPGSREESVEGDVIWEQCTLYTSKPVSWEVASWLGAMPQVIPCMRVWGEEGSEVDAVLVIRQTME